MSTAKIFFQVSALVMLSIIVLEVLNNVYNRIKANLTISIP
ncbi:hypothetical protein IGJ55_000521 [Enterococcus sp. AZ170]|nr:hypothetical protein [Enterococcus ureilyticus]